MGGENRKGNNDPGSDGKQFGGATTRKSRISKIEVLPK